MLDTVAIVNDVGILSFKDFYDRVRIYLLLLNVAIIDHQFILQWCWLFDSFNLNIEI